MAVIVKVRGIWSGMMGAPGYTNWYGLSDGDAAAAANGLGPRMRAFFDAVKAYIPDDASIKVERTYQVINGLNGNITAEGSLTADPAVVAGTATQAYAAPVGACVNWLTGLFNSKGHRIVGRTYLVPLASPAFETNGTLLDTALTAIGAAATAALGGVGGLGVWSRPSAPGANDGVFSSASAAVVHDKACVLRSRRD